jgi:hypothetical protein
VFATYYVATYNKMLPLVVSGPVQNTVIVQVIIRTELLGSVKFSPDIEDTLNLGKFFDKASHSDFSKNFRQNFCFCRETCSGSSIQEQKILNILDPYPAIAASFWSAVIQTTG